MIYTIGYEKLSAMRLRKIIDHVKASHLIDARFTPMSRKPGFGKNQLQAAFRNEYTFMGDVLGGIRPGKNTGPKNAGLAGLLSLQHKHTVILMCLEEVPADCHRHHLIAMPLFRKHGIDSSHIFQNQLIKASELQRSIDAGDDDEYEYEEFEA